MFLTFLFTSITCKSSLIMGFSGSSIVRVYGSVKETVHLLKYQHTQLILSMCLVLLELSITTEGYDI